MGSLQQGRMSHSSRITACWIIKNEATFLACSLWSVRGVADELLIGDTGSSDGSIEIAQAFGAQVLSVPWTGSFADARNAVLERVSDSWVLFLDGDEALESSHRSTIRTLAEDPAAEAYYLDRRHYTRNPLLSGLLPLAEPHSPLNLGAIGYSLSHDVRLFRARSCYRYQGAVHESLEGSLWAQGVSIIRSPALVHHFGPCKASDESVQKHAHYVSIAAERYQSEPDNWKAILDYGVELHQQGKTEEAVRVFRRGVGLFPEQWELHLEFGLILLDQSDARGAIALLRTVAEARPHLTRAWQGLGLAFLRSGDFGTAALCFERCQRMAPDEGVSLVNWGLALLGQGEVSQALCRFERAADLFPGFATASVGKRVCCVLLGAMSLGDSGLTEEDVCRLGGSSLWEVLPRG